ncbi:hypothetical protein Slin15195_G118700 [Septoria linicola]|uniref:Uncharacterized protein n=1 Tax=Septoria linicola TaxID=215465 RepID=A0A9Q9B7L0_9PEZI|nr:hypothetical protein Slin14017_G095690 [Septoria linicola]USW58551.1 hypothetical protein Slin15195_G118700 [Septoria linicola]
MYWVPNYSAGSTRSVVWHHGQAALFFADVYPVFQVAQPMRDTPRAHAYLDITYFAEFEHPDESLRATQFGGAADILQGNDAARLLNLPDQPAEKQRLKVQIGDLVLAKTPLTNISDFYPAEIASINRGQKRVRFLCPLPSFPHLKGDDRPVIAYNQLMRLDKGSALKVNLSGSPPCVVWPSNKVPGMTFTEIAPLVPKANPTPQCSANASVQEKREAGWPECQCQGCENCNEDDSHREVQLAYSEMASGLCQECQPLA